jgi:hypothetical protein
VYLLIPKSQNQLPTHPRIRSLVTPENGAIPGTDCWGADNGAYSGFDPRMFLKMLERLEPEGCRFVCVPDVVGDSAATLELWHIWAPTVLAHGFPPAYVAQDGARTVPVGAAALFIGGTTEWKLSDHARALIRPGRWTHMGRVNSHRRLRLAHSWGVDSVDGSALAWFTDTKLSGYLAASEYRQGVLN